MKITLSIIFVKYSINLYNLSMKLNAHELVKLLLSKKGLKQKELAQMLSQKLDKPYSLGSLSQKLCRGTISYNEVALIADLLGFDIEFVDRKQGVD